MIVESGFRDLRVTPSQGSHFFQNLTSCQIGHFTVNADVGEGFVRWDWLAEQPPVSARGSVRHMRFERPLLVHMNGRQNQGSFTTIIPRVAAEALLDPAAAIR